MTLMSDIVLSFPVFLANGSINALLHEEVEQNLELLQCDEITVSNLYHPTEGLLRKSIFENVTPTIRFLEQHHKERYSEK